MARKDRFRIRPQDKAVFKASKRWAKQQRRNQSKASGKGCALVVLGTAGALAAGVAAVRGWV